MSQKRAKTLPTKASQASQNQSDSYYPGTLARGKTQPLDLDTQGAALNERLLRLSIQNEEETLNSIERSAIHADNQDMVHFIHYIDTLKKEVEGRIPVDEQTDLDQLIALSIIQEGGKRVPVSQFVRDFGKGAKALLSNHEKIKKNQEAILSAKIKQLQVQSRRLRGDSRILNDLAQMENVRKIAVDDIIMKYLVEGKIWENDDFIKYMTEILLASVVNRCRTSTIEFHPCSAKNLIIVHPPYTVDKYSKIEASDHDGFRSSLFRKKPSENEILESVMKNWMMKIKGNLITWRALPASNKSNIFRTSLALTVHTFFYTDTTLNKKRSPDEEIYEDGHHILLCYEEVWDKESNKVGKRKFYIIDQLSFERDHVFNIHYFLCNIFMYESYPKAFDEKFYTDIDMGRDDVNEQFWRENGMFEVIENNMDGEEDVFTCVSRVGRAEVMLAFLENPKAILQDLPESDPLKQIEFKYFNQIARYHLVKMATWILQMITELGSNWRATGPFSKDYVHKITGPEKSYIILHDLSHFVAGSGGHNIKVYRFRPYSNSISGTFEAVRRDQPEYMRSLFDQEYSRHWHARDQAPPICVLSAPFPSFYSLSRGCSPHFLIQ